MWRKIKMNEHEFAKVIVRVRVYRQIKAYGKDYIWKQIDLLENPYLRARMRQAFIELEQTGVI